MDVSTGDELEIVFRVVVAGLLGGFIGLERELRGYPAGVRTIWSAAAIGMATGLSLYIVATLGAVFIFAVLEARPLTRRVIAVLRHVSGDLREDEDHNANEDQEEVPPAL